MDHAATLPAEGHLETATGLNTYKVGFWVFLGSETLFFGSLISTYMVYKHQSVSGPYPHEILNIPLTSISTFVLLMSSLAMVLALAGIQRGNRTQGLFWLLMTALLGSTFLGFQAFEFTEFYHKGLTLQTNLFGSTFFVLTGFHGTHVAIGILMFFARDAARALLARVKDAVRPGGCAAVTVLVEGTTFMRVFDPGRYYLFAPGELRNAFAGWDLLVDDQGEAPAPEETVRRFEMVVARRR